MNPSMDRCDKHAEEIAIMMADVKVLKAIKRDTAAWVKISIPIILGLLAATYSTISLRQDRLEQTLASFAESSINDRRNLAIEAAKQASKQGEQFDRIMDELKDLKDQVSQLQRR